MKVWVTGANGLLGSALKLALDEYGIPFVGSSKLQADVSDLLSLTQFYRKWGPFTHVVNCAAFTDIDLAESRPEEARKINTLSLAIIGSLATQHHFKVIHISTGYVFDGLADHPYLETDRIAPHTVYGQTKAEGEKHLLAALPSACIIRTSWLFGLEGKSFASKMLQLMQEKEEIAVVSDQYGRPTCASDLAKTIICALDWSGIYHAANSSKTNWYDFAETIRFEALAIGWPIKCRHLRPIRSAEFGALAPRPLYSVLDTSKCEKKLGSAFRSWRDGLKELMEALHAYSF
jgi:dTDP-4-dehydrorhamnose reductase